MLDHLIIVERTCLGFQARSPEFPGCVASAATPEEARLGLCRALAYQFVEPREGGRCLQDAEAAHASTLARA